MHPHAEIPVASPLSKQDINLILRDNARLHHIVAETHSKILWIEEPGKVGISFQEPGASYPWFHYALRDRSKDGNKEGYNPQIDGIENEGAVEESTYWLDPRESIYHHYPSEIASFIHNPFEALPFENPTKKALEDWIMLWNEIVQLKDPPHPGQYALQKIPGLRRNILENSLRVLREKNWQQLHAIPTWYHTQKLYNYLGYEYIHMADKARVEMMQEKLSHVPEPYDSWIVMLQFWAELAEQNGVHPENYVPNAYILRDQSNQIITYPLSPEKNLWMTLPI
ncbi:hypothetical protein HGA88_04605 [Candidatus Roizmanbacteria bacterium]|nr:hypothetical protein [Candidatus Roizmanbacteria bacterium]